MNAFRIVIFTSAPPPKIAHFLWRLRLDLPEVEVAGVLHETERAPLPFKRRLKRIKKYYRDPQFLKYTAHKIAAQAGRKLAQGVSALLRLAHAAPRNPNPPISWPELAAECETRGIALRSVKNLNDTANVPWLQALNADLGIIYGTRILKPQIFAAPRLGAINIHKHKVPDYRGSGAPGLWELRDGQTEQTVTVHRVLPDVDAGAVLGERSFPFERFDTLASVGLKADLLSVDCLIDVIRAESQGVTVERPQTHTGTVYKGYQPHQIWAIEQEINRVCQPYQPERGRPFFKLALRTLFYPALALKNRRRAQEKNFPVTILFHHLITDRRKNMGLPTEHFLRHIRFLKEHYRIVSLPEALALLEQGPVEAPTVALTFDDGYADNFLGLRAVAEFERVPVTLFVCTQHVTERSEFQHDVNRREHGFPALSWEEVRYLDRHNFCIGSHTRTHLDCGTADEDKLRDEIIGSRADLQRELGRDVPYFAFPKGHPANMSAPAQSLALQTYQYVFSAHGGNNHAPLAPGVILKRFGHPDLLLELELGLQSVLDFN